MDDVIEENQEEKQQEEPQEEQEGDCHKDEDETADKDETEIDHKECYRFGKSLPEASKAVQKKLCTSSRTRLKTLPKKAVRRQDHCPCYAEVGP